MAQSYTSQTAAGGRATQIDKGLRSHMNNVYGTMSVGMLISFLAAWALVGLSMTTEPSNAVAPWNANNYLTSFGYILFATPLKWVLMFAPLLFVFGFSAGINRLSAAAAQTVFYAFAAVMGISICRIFMAFTDQSIIQVFLVTAVAFAGLSLYGHAIKRDLSAMGTFLMMGFIGLFGAMVINLSFIELSLIIAVIKIIGLALLILIAIYVLVQHFFLVLLLGLIVAIDVVFSMGVGLISDPAAKLDEQVEIHRQLQKKKMDIQNDIYDKNGEIWTRSAWKKNGITTQKGIIDKLKSEIKDKISEVSSLDSQIHQSESTISELAVKLEKRNRDSWIKKARVFVLRQAKKIGSSFVPDQSSLGDAISFFGVLIFAGLTAYDTQKIKTTYLQMAHVSDQEWLGKAAIMGALSLYLDFINMFMFLLQLFGTRE